MATVKKLIGRLPVYKGDWVAGIYSMLNQVSYLGSTFQSKIDNNTSQPATLVNNVLQVNSNWNVISNGTAAYLADSRLTSVEGKTAVLEQNVNLFNRRPQGLRFKSGDNTVFAKAMKALVLGTDDFTVCVVARTEGSSDTNPIMGFSNPLLTSSVFIATDTDWMSNGINWVKVGGLESVNWIPIGKKDSTTNLHHIVITRSGTLVTCTINGRLVKSVTQDRVLDFSNFIYDIANTSYFWGGAVFNYAMTQAESNKLLWNGGRYDEVKLPEGFYIKKGFYENVNKKSAVVTDSLIKIRHRDDDVWSAFPLGKSYNVTLKCISNNKVGTFSLVFAQGHGGSPQKSIISRKSLSNVEVGDIISVDYTIGFNCHCMFYYPYDNADASFEITIREKTVLLEYRPENIRKDRYLNTGIEADGDLVYSPTPPEIILDDPYQDVVMLDENKAPDWHPIAMGQEVETPTNIFKAKLPDLGKEWQVSDWKQVNN